MTKRHPDEVILARWTVEPLLVRQFAERVRARYSSSPFPPRDLLEACEESPPSGLDVVFREDAVFVGTWDLSFLYNLVSDIQVEEEWMLFVMDGGAFDIPVPLARNGRAEADRMKGVYRRQAEEENRKYREERDAPTFRNRLLNLAEAHPALLLLGVFFVAIPLVVLLLTWLHGDGG